MVVGDVQIVFGTADGGLLMFTVKPDGGLEARVSGAGVSLGAELSAELAHEMVEVLTALLCRRMALQATSGPGPFEQSMPLAAGYGLMQKR